MTRPMNDSPYIFGIHDPGGEQMMLDAGKPGWVLCTEEIGDDPNAGGGKNYDSYVHHGLGVMVRLNNGYYRNGTIPHSSRYEQFARRCANFVAGSQGCHIWIIGNEMNHPIERAGVELSWGRAVDQPGDDWHLTSNRDLKALFDDPEGGFRGGGLTVINPGEAITPAMYADCFRRCRTTIRALPGHENDQVLIGSVAPWNAMTTYPGNESGDWIRYFTDILNQLGPTGLDGITIHTYSRGSDPALVTAPHKMGAPFGHYHSDFQTYRDFMAAIPKSMRHLPVYCTETDENAAWDDRNTGWIQAAYAEIDRWNNTPGNQQIRAMILYRWQRHDAYFMEDLGGIHEDLRAALHHEYRWHASPSQPVTTPPPVTPADFQQGQVVYTTGTINVRRTAGFGDKLDQAPEGTACTILGGPVAADGLVWWQIRYTHDGRTVEGWMAQADLDGAPLLTRHVAAPREAPPAPAVGVREAEPQPPARPTIHLGDWVRAVDEVNLRQTPGWRGKGPEDVIHRLPPAEQAQVVSGPRSADDLAWWQLRAIGADGQTVLGWGAQTSAGGRTLLEPVATVQQLDGGLPPVTEAPASKADAAPTAIRLGDHVRALDEVNLRQSPGWRGKPPTDVLYPLPAGNVAQVIAGPRLADGLHWWQLRATDHDGQVILGWGAEAAASGRTLLEMVPSPEEARALAPHPTLPTTPASTTLRVGNQVFATTQVRIRQSPGFQGKPNADVVGSLVFGARAQVIAGPLQADGLQWWQLRVNVLDSQGTSIVVGWTAESDGAGTPLLVTDAPALPAAAGGGPPKVFRAGDLVCNISPSEVNLRRSPGYRNRPSDHVLLAVPPGTMLTILDGRKPVDGLIWWRVAGQVSDRLVDGWMADVATNGTRFLVPAHMASAIRVAKPFEGNWRVTQLWGKNGDYYSRFSYWSEFLGRRVALKGHNGIDFGTPVGTKLLAVDGGQVVETAYEEKGFGHYVKLRHAWGESIYAHMSKVEVKKGDELAQGALLGLSGNTGGSTGPHLHFSIRIFPNERGDGWGGYCDPTPFMNPEDLIIPDSIRAITSEEPPSAMAEDDPNVERP